MKYIFLILFGIYGISCHRYTNQLDPTEEQNIKNDINQMTVNLESDLARSGPSGWIPYFDDQPEFFMVTDGELVFKNYEDGKEFIEKTLVTKILKIRLVLDQLKIEPLTSRWASLAAHFHEDLSDPLGMNTSVSGYVTATLENTRSGWKFLNLHWSIQK